MTAQQLELVPVERCDYCGPLDWTKERYGQVVHKHSCPHRQDPFCQAHPQDCSRYEVKPMPNPNWPLESLPGETWEEMFR